MRLEQLSSAAGTVWHLGGILEHFNRGTEEQTFRYIYKVYWRTCLSYKNLIY